MTRQPLAAHTPLAGVRVLEVAHLVPAGIVGWWLAALGAEVVKVEDPQRGDYTRAIPPYVEGEGLMHQVGNQGKASIALDLASEDGRATFRSLVAAADVVIDGFRPGALARRGVDLAELRRERPELIVCSVSGFGQEGPLAGLGAHGTTIDTLAGVTPIRKTRDGSLELAWELSSTLGIETGAQSAVIAILAAILEVRTGGDGAWIDVSLWDAAVHANRFAMAWALAGQDGPVFATQRGPLNAPYRCADGDVVWFAAIEEKFWRRFCRAVDRPDLADSWAGQGEVGFGDDSIRSELRALFETKTGQEWEKIFSTEDIPGNVVLDAAGVVRHPHFAARNLASEAAGTLRTVGAAPVWLDTGHRVGHGLMRAPGLGADTEDIIRNWTESTHDQVS
jgi:alpha-methylacyl-CoA racemase